MKIDCMYRIKNEASGSGEEGTAGKTGKLTRVLPLELNFEG